MCPRCYAEQDRERRRVQGPARKPTRVIAPPVVPWMQIAVQWERDHLLDDVAAVMEAAAREAGVLSEDGGGA